MIAILAFLKNLRLSLTQWVVVTLSAAVGLLVLALRFQGSRLHRAQLQLLGSQLDRKDQDAQTAVDQAVAKAKPLDEKYQQLRKEFLDAGGKL